MQYATPLKYVTTKYRTLFENISESIEQTDHVLECVKNEQLSFHFSVEAKLVLTLCTLKLHVHTYKSVHKNITLCLI